jgi:hypothetical protein
MARDSSGGFRSFPDIPLPAALTALGAGALALRLVLVMQLATLPIFSAHFSDTRLYMDMVASLFGGGDGRAFFMSPLYPLLIALVDMLTGNADLVLRILQACMGAATAVLVQRIGARIFGAPAGWIAGIWTALHPMLLAYDASLLSESLLTLLVTATVLLTVRMRDEGGLRLSLATGVLMGLLVIGRATFVALPLALIAALWIDGRRAAAATDEHAAKAVRSGQRPAARTAGIVHPGRAVLMLIGTVIVVILPVTLHNVAVEGRLIPIVSSTGFNLYAGNNADAGGLYTVPERIDLITDPGGRFHAERAMGRTLASDEVSAYWFDRAMTWITAQPTDWLALLVRKALLMLRAEEIEQIGFGAGFIRHEYATLLDLPLPGMLVLLPMGMVGIALALGARVRHGGMLSLMLLLFVLATILFFVNGRFRVPVTPILLVFAGHGLVELWRGIRGGAWRRLGLPIGVGVLVLLAATVAQPEMSQSYELEYTRLGELAFDAKDYDEAERLFLRSLEERVTVEALVNLGNTHAVRGRAGDAGAAYDRALTIDPQSHLALFNLGNLAMQSGNVRAAATLWQRALAANGAFAPAHRNLGLLLVRSGHVDEGVAHLRSFLTYERDARARAEIERDLRTIESLK